MVINTEIYERKPNNGSNEGYHRFLIHSPRIFGNKNWIHRKWKPFIDSSDMCVWIHWMRTNKEFGYYLESSAQYRCKCRFIHIHDRSRWQARPFFCLIRLFDCIRFFIAMPEFPLRLSNALFSLIFRAIYHLKRHYSCWCICFASIHLIFDDSAFDLHFFFCRL